MNATTDVTEDDGSHEIDMCSRISPPVKFNAIASFFALAVVTTIRIATFWQQKSIGYFYGYKASGSELANIQKFEIAQAYPQMESYYGALVGLCFTLPYAISGLYAGSITRRGNRKWMLFGVIGVMSLL